MKRDINTNRKIISSKEIQKGKNFSELKKAYNAQLSITPTKPYYKKGWFSGTLASVALITTAVILLNTNNTKKETNESQNTLTVLSDTAQTKFINPPAPGIDVKKNRYFVNADAGGKIIHHTGTEIDIPSGSFIKEDGTPVTGEVEIEYRELHDQIDIFFSGIPMEYDSAGTKYNFESAGMMEIYAYQNGEKLKIAPKKELNLAMTSYNLDPKFNLYYLDEEAKNWDYRGKDSIVNEQDFTFSPSPIDNNNMIDESLFSKKEAVKEQEQIVEVIKKDIKVIEKAKPTKPLKAQKNVHSFDIDVNKAEFPEIAEYSGTLFEVIDQVNFDTKIYDIEWEDIVLKQNETNLCIELTKGKQTKKIDVKPVLEGEDYTTAIKEFSRKFEGYSKKLAARKSDEKKAERELLARKEAYEKAMTERKKISQTHIKLQQKKQLVNKTREQIFGNTRENGIRRFRIPSLGIWNSDCPHLPKAPEGKKVLAKYQNANTGKEIKILRADLIEKRRNMSWMLNEAQRQTLSFNPKQNNFMWCLTNDNKVAYLTPMDFKGLRNRSEHTFKVKIVDIENKTIKELKELIRS